MKKKCSYGDDEMFSISDVITNNDYSCDSDVMIAQEEKRREEKRREEKRFEEKRSVIRRRRRQRRVMMDLYIYVIHVYTPSICDYCITSEMESACVSV